MLYLDATQFAGMDVCAKINAAYLALPNTGGTIDARGFTGIRACSTNPFAGANKPVVLLLGAAQIVTAVPWVTPQLPHRIIGIEPSAAPTVGMGATLGQANHTLIQACGPSAINWQQSGPGTMNCGPSGSTVSQFPANTSQLSFTFPHGPFPGGPTGTNYAAIINGGGCGMACANSSAAFDWTAVALGGRVENVFLDCGGNSNCFGYYTQDEQERSGLVNVGCGHLAANSACAFWDRTSDPGPAGTTLAPAGTTHFSAHDVSMNNIDATGIGTSTYGLVMEGAPILLTLTGGSGSGALAYVSSVDSNGAIQAAIVTSGGSGYSPTPPSCAVHGTNTTPAMCTAAVSAGRVTSILFPMKGTGYQQGLLGGGPDSISNITMAGGVDPGPPPTTYNITGGIWIEGYNDSQIGYVHCEYFTGDCLLFGSGDEPMNAGFVHNIDTANSNNNVVHIGFGVDNNAQFRSIGANGSATTNVVKDDQNGVTLMTPTWQYIAEYLPGGHPAPFTPYVQTLNFRNRGSLIADGVNGTPDSMGDSAGFNPNTPTAIAATSSEPALISIATPAMTNSIAGVHGQANYKVGSNIFFQAYASIDQSVLTSQRVWIALTHEAGNVMGGSDTPVGNYAAFRYSTGAGDTTWQCVTNNGTTASVANSLVTVNNSGHRFEIVMNDSTTPTATFRIDGVVVCAGISAKYPTANTLVQMQLDVTALSAAVRHATFSYLDAYQDPRH